MEIPEYFSLYQSDDEYLEYEKIQTQYLHDLDAEFISFQDFKPSAREARIADADYILEFLETRKIQKLLHFTSVSNLSSILELGLLSVRNLSKMQVDFKRFDNNRYDQRTDAISISISEPNWPVMFQFQSRGMLDYAVIELNPQALLEIDYLAFPINAAHRYSQSWLDAHPNDFCGIRGLKRMFANGGKIVGGQRVAIRREDLEIRDFQPTSIQAELMFFDKIPPNLISSIHINRTVAEQFYSQGLSEKLLKLLPREKWDLDCTCYFPIQRDKNLNTTRHFDPAQIED